MTTLQIFLKDLENGEISIIPTHDGKLYVLKAEMYLDDEKEQIIDAYNAGFSESIYNKAEEYFNNKYNDTTDNHNDNN